jgi:hypothetical protein
VELTGFLRNIADHFHALTTAPRDSRDLHTASALSNGPDGPDPRRFFDEDSPLPSDKCFFTHFRLSLRCYPDGAVTVLDAADQSDLVASGDVAVITGAHGDDFSVHNLVFSTPDGHFVVYVNPSDIDKLTNINSPLRAGPRMLR